MVSPYNTVLPILPLLGPSMVKVFNTFTEEVHFPRDTLKAHISIIPKEGKDPSPCSSYRPISLLNIDLKLFTKILTNRLVQHMQDIVHLDQVGFILSREARDNTTNVLNLIHVASVTKTQCIFLRTDAEKALDHVNWEFMSSVLKHIGLGAKMVQRILNIYSTPTA